MVASAGYSLMSEAVYLRKPMLALPLAGQFEQEMNARYLERLGYGTVETALDEAALERFLAREPLHVETLSGYDQDGNDGRRSRRSTVRSPSWRRAPLSDLHLGRTLLLFAWALRARRDRDRDRGRLRLGRAAAHLVSASAARSGACTGW